MAAGATTASDSEPHVTDVHWEIVKRVIASASFQRSRRLRELLLYICEHGLQNRPDELREQLIGYRVLGRQSDYNPAEDNIVRVEVRMLRKRLEEYFSGDGRSEPVIITIPKGSYMPSFQLASPSVSCLSVEALPAGSPAPTALPGHRRLRLWIWIQPLAIVLLTAMCLWMWHEWKRPASSGTADANSSSFWTLMFNKDHQTSIVCADSSLVVAQALLHHPISLDRYLAHNYEGTAKISNETAVLLQRLQRWQYTNISDTRLVQRLSEINASRWGSTSIRSAQTAQIQDFKTGNVVILGSSRSNPWNSLFEQQLNFSFSMDEHTGITFIRNKAPRHGEQEIYRSAHPGEAGEEYSILAFVPNLRGTGNVLLIAGASAEGTEAAGEFITNSDTCARLFQQVCKGGRVSYFEVLLQSPTIADVARRASIVSVRLLPAAPSAPKLATLLPYSQAPL